MHSKLVLTGGLVAAAFIAAACSTTSSSGLYGAPSSAPSAAPSAAPVAAPPAASGTAINVGTTGLGQVLVDSNWPPVLTSGAPVPGTGVNGSLLGTTARADGTTQVTYGGHPLYRFISDKKAGDATGQGVTAFGAPWYVVSPSGALIR